MQRTATVSSKFGTKNVNMSTRKEIIAEFLYSRNILIQSIVQLQSHIQSTEYIQGINKNIIHLYSLL